MICLLHLGVRQLPSGKMIILIGQGEDGKSMQGLIDRCALGSNNIGNIDFSIFLDRNEFRKSTREARNKIGVRLYEGQADKPVQTE